MKLKSLLMPVITICVSALLLFVVSAATAASLETNAKEELNSMMASLLPGSENFEQEVYDGEDESIVAVYKGETGYVIQTSTYGYAGDVVLLVGVDNDGNVTGLVVREMTETYGLGRNALTDMEFLSQFLGTAGDAEIGNNVDALSGATVTSKAVARGVNAAVAYVTGADTTSSATTWGG